jgi:regulator of PEP synthase PpsR (kinase-PPPase family)
MEGGFHLHLVSDATGETLNSVMRACLVQFEGIAVTEHNWPLIRTAGQLDRVLKSIAQHPGLVLYTIVNHKLRDSLVSGCRALQVPIVPVLDPVINAMAIHFGTKARGLSGRQHELDAEYFDRIEAMNFALNHDDGQSARNYNEADVILVGVSRSSKTPTCIYLANRGIKAANVPIVPGCPLPSELFQAGSADWADQDSSRSSRSGAPMQMIARDEDDYVDPGTVRRRSRRQGGCVASTAGR